MMLLSLAFSFLQLKGQEVTQDRCQCPGQSPPLRAGDGPALTLTLSPRLCSQTAPSCVQAPNRGKQTSPGRALDMCSVLPTLPVVVVPGTQGPPRNTQLSLPCVRSCDHQCLAHSVLLKGRDTHPHLLPQQLIKPQTSR